MSFSRYLGLAFIAGSVAAISYAAEFIFGKQEMYAKEYALVKVRSQRPKESWDIINSVEEAIKKSDAVFDREKKIVNEALDNWKESSGYSKTIEVLTKNKSKELNEIRKAFNLESKKADIFAEADKAIEQFKETIGYDTNMSNLNKSINDAESAYELQKTTLKLTCNGNETLYDNMKEAAKKAKKDIVDSAKKGISNLDKQVNDRMTIINAERDRKIADISAELTQQENTVKNRFAKDISGITAEMNEKVNEINSMVIDNRSEADNELVVNAKRLVAESENIRAAEQIVAQDVYRDMSTTEKIAATLKMTDWKEWQFVLVAIIPAAAVLFGVGVYCSKVVEIVKYMKTIDI